MTGLWIAVLLAAVATASCAVVRPAGVTTSGPASRTLLAGGYTAYRPLEASDRAVFRQAVPDGTLTPVEVATQVVAGLNYRFRCRRADRGEEVVVVYRDLRGNVSLTSRETVE